MASTKENLETAFAGESQAFQKYTNFAAKAEKDGFPNVARLFRIHHSLCPDAHTSGYGNWCRSRSFWDSHDCQSQHRAVNTTFGCLSLRSRRHFQGPGQPYYRRGFTLSRCLPIHPGPDYLFPGHYPNPPSLVGAVVDENPVC